MTKTTGPIAPLWTWHVTLGSATLALVSHFIGGGRITSVLTTVTLTGITYLLYKWGQHRDPPSKYSDDDSKRQKEMEMEAEAGGYGGNM